METNITGNTNSLDFEQDLIDLQESNHRDFEKTLTSDALKNYLNKQEFLKQKEKELNKKQKKEEVKEQKIEQDFTKNDVKNLENTSIKGLVQDKKLWPLNEKQRKFVKSYVQSGGKKVDSYMTAYKGVTRGAANALSTNLLKKENILAAIDEELLSVKSISRIDRVYVVGKLKDLAERSEDSGNFKYLIESLDMLCKIEGLYNPAPNQGGIINTGNMNIMFGDFEPGTGKIHPIAATNNIEEAQWTDLNSDDEEIDENSNDYQSF